MNYLLAKIKGHGKGYAMVLSNKTVYDTIPDFTKQLPYDDDYKLKSDEWFVVTEFSQKDYCPSIIKEAFVAADYSYLNFKGYKTVDYTVSLQGDEQERVFIFQNITSSYLYARYKAVAWNVAFIRNDADQPELIEKEGLLEIRTIADCYYIKKEDKLLFKNLSAITSIFKGIAELYREATEQEVTDFLKLDCLSVDPAYDSSKVKTANRRKIKEATEKYNKFSDEDKLELKEYINDFCPAIYSKDTDTYKIESEDTLSNFLNAVNEKFYTTRIKKQKRLANSTTDI